jgi:hypothetical protein
MPRLRCPGMDPAYFKPEDIQMHPCIECGEEIEFWKDDVKLKCPHCRQINFNPALGNSCLVYCKKAEQCLGNNDIKEWRTRIKSVECLEENKNT